MNLRLAIVLGFAALIRPGLSILGAYQGPLGKPFGPLLITALICVGWVAAVVLAKVEKPVPTLVAAGLAYGIGSILLNWCLQPFLDSAETIPLPGYFGILIFNALLGAVLGGIAWLIRRRSLAS
ncbi:hypothetical protein AB0C29_27260 [Actinoplanes sp. NPDC048791]|uniref:hypothetical protein n=1 Tax=Actinoplanes sp. NPDC048791 TaxID=3154623 RepID=UPI0033EA5D56